MLAASAVEALHDACADALASIQDPVNNAVIVHGGPKRGYDLLRADVFGEPLRGLGGMTTLDLDGDGKSDVALSPEFRGPCADLPTGEKVVACGAWCAFKQGDPKYKYCGEIQSVGGSLKDHGSQMLGADLGGTGRDTLLVATMRDPSSFVDAVLLPKDDTDVDETKDLVGARGGHVMHVEASVLVEQTRMRCVGLLPIPMGWSGAGIADRRRHELQPNTPRPDRLPGWPRPLDLAHVR